MASTARPRIITPEEYLARERQAPFKSEFIDGHIYPMGDPIRGMAGTSRVHNLITLNLAGGLHQQLKNRPCEVYIGDLRVLTAEDFTCPDVVAVCGDRQFSDENFDTLLNPSLIVEVLSPSTASWDRGGKVGLYKQLNSLREYVLISQDRMRVELYSRQDAGWALTTWERPDDLLQLASIGCAVPLREIYARVELPTA